MHAAILSCSPHLLILIFIMYNHTIHDSESCLLTHSEGELYVLMVEANESTWRKPTQTRDKHAYPGPRGNSANHFFTVLHS